MSEIIKLPEPVTNGTMSLEKAIVTRRSWRDFLNKPLSLEQVSQLCWAAQGKQQGGCFRNAPSAGATYPLELFVVEQKGLFKYLPEKHALEEITKEDLREKLCSAALGQSFIAEAPLTLVIAAEFSRTTGLYRQRGIKYVFMEAGHAAQNVQLQAVSLGLGSVAVGAFDDGRVRGVLSLPERPEPVYLLTIGYCQGSSGKR
jgi:SagB-type dehydrogenase family enzyme